MNINVVINRREVKWEEYLIFLTELQPSERSLPFKIADKISGWGTIYDVTRVRCVENLAQIYVNVTDPAMTAQRMKESVFSLYNMYKDHQLS